MRSFREFIIKELESAPGAGGGPTAPTSNKTTNDFNFGTRELGGFYGLKRRDYLKEPIASFEPLTIPGQPQDVSPMFIDLSDSDDENGGATGTVLNTAKNNARDKMRNPDGTLFTGKLKDTKVTLRNRDKKGAKTLDDILLAPYQQMSGGAGAMPPPIPGGM
jgi:hypothetical protein